MVSFLAEEVGDEGFSVDGEVSGEFDLGEVGNGGEHVGHRDEDVLPAFLAHAGGVDDEGDVSAFGAVAAVLAIAGGSVVGAEDEDGVVGEARFLELVAVEPDLIVEVVDVVVNAGGGDSAVGIVDAIVAGDPGLGAGVFFTVPFDDGCARPLAGGSGVEPIESIVSEMTGVVDKEGLAGFLLALHVVEDEVKFDVGSVGVESEGFSGFLGIGPPLESGRAVLIHEPDVGEPIPSVLLVGVDRKVGVGIEEGPFAVDLLVVVFKIGEGVVSVGEVARG